MKLFKKPKSKFYWFDFMVRGRRYYGSTQETKAVRAVQVPGSKTPEGRRLVPMSGRVFEILRNGCHSRQEGWYFRQIAPPRGI